MSRKRLYSFFVDCGRMGSLDGLFIATKKEVKGLEGKNLYFDEPLGKHSEYSFDFSEEYYSEIKLPKVVVDALEKACGKHVSGFNPFDHYEELEPDDWDEE